MKNKDIHTSVKSLYETQKDAATPASTVATGTATATEKRRSNNNGKEDSVYYSNQIGIDGGQGHAPQEGA